MLKFYNVKQSKIKIIKQIEDDIKVELWKNKDEILIDTDEYKKCLAEIRKESNSSLNFGSILIIVGIFILAAGYFKDTTLYSHGSEYHDIELIHEKIFTYEFFIKVL